VTGLKWQKLSLLNNMNLTAHTKIQDAPFKWHLVDAQGEVLGRVATKVARKLNGKEDTSYSPNFYMKDKVVVINVEKVVFTGNKLAKKMFFWHTGFPKGLRSESLSQKFQKSPETVFRKAVEGMLPKNKLRSIKISNLYLYKGSEHPHEAQLKVNV
jgi:large subunit ribosomal protein L13